mgnify:CR=1 FL=1
MEGLRGRDGTAVANRLDSANAEPATVIAAARQALTKWQRKAESPLSAPDLATAARVLVRAARPMPRRTWRLPRANAKAAGKAKAEDEAQGAVAECSVEEPEDEAEVGVVDDDWVFMMGDSSATGSEGIVLTLDSACFDHACGP